LRRIEVPFLTNHVREVGSREPYMNRLREVDRMAFMMSSLGSGEEAKTGGSPLHADPSAPISTEESELEPGQSSHHLSKSSLSLTSEHMP
jgi:hypothetical protein